ncbi:MAG: MBL fold metallo-hydrolase [Candidatus Berkelbacteria bacterium]|nr:MBL fold metallo-hydrolase [Candidatus Berkelbacteria bacterium]
MYRSKFIENLKYWLLVFLAALAITVWLVYFKEPDQNLHLVTLDVGQGDSILIEKGSEQILVDGGPDDKVLSELAKFMPIEDREIEEVILTHPHSDHVTGLVEVLSRYKVDKIDYNGMEYTSSVYKNFLQIAKEKNIPIHVPRIGNEEKVFGSGIIKFLWPGDNVVAYSNDPNDTSEVFKFTYGIFSALLTGDLQTDAWQQVIANNKSDIENIDYLKDSHHGSKTGMTDEIAGIILPRVAVISCGAGNSYGFPHKEVLDALSKVGADIYRTDQNGSVDFSISADGKKWWKN